MNSRFRFLWIRESFDPIGWRKMRLRTMERTAFKEVNLKFIIRRCHIGDETSLSLLGKAAFLETYAGSKPQAFVEAEHSAGRYRSWLESHFAKI